VLARIRSTKTDVSSAVAHAVVGHQGEQSIDVAAGGRGEKRVDDRAVDAGRHGRGFAAYLLLAVASAAYMIRPRSRDAVAGP
jgi:hypothetical protein